jgi:small subunit ribosomal protein S13
MPRIAGINIPDDKQIKIALTYIHGIGSSLSEEILSKANVKPSIKASEIKPDEINRLREIIEKEYKIEGDLRREKMMSIKRMKDIGCWKGMRHAKNLPARGQRTKSNSRTIRGNVRRTVGSGRKPAPTPK